MRVAVVGARGQLGAAIVYEFSSGHDVTALGRADLDVADQAAVADAMKRVAPDAIINCAAYNAVDAAEDHPIDALKVNAIAVRTLALEAATTGATLVHYGSDFVFDGRASRPYTEEDHPNPQSVYATSKMLGEWFALDAPHAYVLRVESLFGSAPSGPEKGTLTKMASEILAGQEAVVFEDRTVTPTYVVDAARATRHLVEARPATGLYHCVNSGACTWLELANEMAHQLGVEPRLQVRRMADVPMRAARPRYCALSNQKLASVGMIMPSWQGALRQYLKSLKSQV